MGDLQMRAHVQVGQLHSSRGRPAACQGVLRVLRRRREERGGARTRRGNARRLPMAGRGRRGARGGNAARRRAAGGADVDARAARRGDERRVLLRERGAPHAPRAQGDRRRAQVVRHGRAAAGAARGRQLQGPCRCHDAAGLLRVPHEATARRGRPPSWRRGDALHQEHAGAARAPLPPPSAAPHPLRPSAALRPSPPPLPPAADPPRAHRRCG